MLVGLYKILINVKMGDRKNIKWGEQKRISGLESNINWEDVY